MPAPEYSTIVNCVSQLENALHEDRDIGHHLYKENFITLKVYEDVINPRSKLTAIEKAGELVSGIRRRVGLNSDNFEKIMSYFRQYSDKYADIIDILDRTYENNKSASSQQIQHEEVEIHDNPSETEVSPSMISSTTDSDISEGLSRITLEPHFPFLPSTDDREYLMQKLDAETSRIKAKFSKFVNSVKNHIQQLKMELSDFINVFVHYDFNFNDILANAKTIAEIFIILSRYSSFFNYELIKLVVDTCTNDFFKEEFLKYKQKLQNFFKRRICECPSDAFGEKPKDEKLFVIKINKTIECEVKVLDKLRAPINRILGTKFLRLLSVDKGCIQLTFRTLPLVEEDIFSIIQDQVLSLKDLGVLSIKYGNTTYQVQAYENISSSEAVRLNPDPTFGAVDFSSHTIPGKDLKDADSGHGTLSEISSPVLTHTVDNTSITTAEHKTEEFQGRDLIDARLDMIISAENTTEYNKELFIAAEEGNLEEVKRLVAFGHNPMGKNKQNNNVIHVAAMHGRMEVLEYLIDDQGCNPASLGQDNTTALHQAALFKHLTIVQYLIDKHQVDSLFQDDNGYSPLHSACQGGDLTIVKYLMNAILTYMRIEDIFNDFTKFKTTPIHVAALEGHANLIKYFIDDLKCDPNLPSGVDGRGSIYQAAQNGHLSIVQYLISEHGCDPASRDLNQATILHMASQQGHLPVVVYLTQNMKCDPLCRDKFNHTPFQNACINGHIDVIEFFISAMHCNPNDAIGQFGRTPLHGASQDGHLNLVKCLIEEYGCDPSSQDENNATPLHVAAARGHLLIIKYLTQKKGCDPMCRDSVNYTPLHYAAGCSQYDVLKYFIEFGGSDPSSVNDGLSTPLHMAAAKGCLPIVKYLTLEKGCNSSCQDSDNDTPLLEAAKNGHLEVVKFLFESLHCSLTVRGYLNQTPLERALNNGHREVVEYITSSLF